MTLSTTELVLFATTCKYCGHERSQYAAGRLASGAWTNPTSPVNVSVVMRCEAPGCARARTAVTTFSALTQAQRRLRE